MQNVAIEEREKNNCKLDIQRIISTASQLYPLASHLHKFILYSAN